MSFVGIYASGPIIRVCEVDDDGDIEYTECDKRDQSFSIQDLLSPSGRFAPAVSDCLKNRDVPIWLALPGGAYQMRRVPLEVAEEVDQRSQVYWEVTQALSAKDGDYSISYVVRGSSAIWVAISTSCVDTLTSAFAECGLTLAGVCAGPIAVVQTLRHKHPTGSTTGILVESGWISTVNLQDGALISATTQNPARQPDSDAASRDFWHAALEKRICQSPDQNRTYLVGEQALIGDFMQTINPSHHPALLYPTGLGNQANDTPPRVDTLTSVAYGAALFGMSGETL